MRGVEINRGHAARIGGQVRQDVAAAGRNREDMAVRRDRQRFHIDFRVFPDLRINEPLEGEGKRALKHGLL